MKLFADAQRRRHHVGRGAEIFLHRARHPLRHARRRPARAGAGLAGRRRRPADVAGPQQPDAARPGGACSLPGRCHAARLPPHGRGSGGDAACRSASPDRHRAGPAGKGITA
ncbi:hypothetical protein AB5I41_27725 [Sphingomonas sp. MMS24-JH45]